MRDAPRMSGPTSVSVSAIVLAGGRSSRFGRDKLAEPIAGEPLLNRTIAALGPVATVKDAGERRLGALADALDVAAIAEKTWRLLDPGGATLRDIDTLDDLPAPG